MPTEGMITEKISSGVDIVNIQRIQRSYRNERFLKRVFTDLEIDYSLGKRLPYKHLAGRFAAKEACLKALATGLSEGISLRDIEVINSESGKPGLRLHSEAKRFLGNRRAHLSISYSKEFAFAIVAIA